MKKKQQTRIKPRNWVALLMWEAQRGHVVIKDRRKEESKKQCRRRIDGDV